MESLANGMMQAGVIELGVRACICGVANLHKQVRAIGSVNAAFAERFLNAEGIMPGHWDVGGDGARRVDFSVAQGKARCRPVVQPAALPSALARKLGDVEVF